MSYFIELDLLKLACKSRFAIPKPSRLERGVRWEGKTDLQMQQLLAAAREIEE
jgi:hypothetical protein